MDAQFLTGDFRPLAARSLHEDTCRKYGYRVGQDEKGAGCQVADYRSVTGEVIAQKVRYADKSFRIIGDGKAMPLYGQHLWAPGGKRLVITEGEIDALSVAQAFGLSWPAVSLPNGANAAKKALQANLEYVESFEEVVLLFDMDEPGRKAAAECAALLSPGKAKIGELPRKDANEMLKAGEVKALVSAVYQARPYRPGGIVNGAEIWDRIMESEKPGRPYPWRGLTVKTNGQQAGTLITWTAGTGIGKSTILRAVAYNEAFGDDPVTVGMVALEENVGRTAKGFLSLKLGKLAHVPGRCTDEELRAAFDATLATGRVFLHDHWGSVDGGDLLSKIRFMIVGCECKVIVLDHLSIVVSGMDLADDERRTIDKIMTDLRSLVEETGVTLHLISHLKRTSGEPAEEGGRVTLSQLRGSQSIAQLSDAVIGVERNNQEPDSPMVIRVLKNRLTGDTGIACSLAYDRETGVLTELDDDVDQFETEDAELPF